ncbi:MAG: GTPase [Planctomycetota bacterium]
MTKTAEPAPTLPGSTSPPRECLIAELTPQGRGAVAVVAVCGAGALQLVDHCFQAVSGRSLRDSPAGRIAFGHWRTAAGPSEELVVNVHTPTWVEVQCHGGVAAIRRVTSDLVQAGGRLVPWTELPLAEQYRMGSADAADDVDDILVTEAIIALSEAKTERIAGLLLDQLRGALAGELARIQRLIDSSELPAAQHELELLSRLIPAGRHAIEPSRMVLAGRPNVGKSSLLNALAGYQRAVVSPLAGTTRDVVTTTLAIDGWPIELHDTAGQRSDVADLVEQLGVQRARAEWQAAHLILFLIDATTAWHHDDQQLLDELMAANHSVLIIHSKTDLAPQPKDGRPIGLSVSALTASGLDELQRQIIHRLVPHLPAPGAAVPFTTRQISRLQDVRDALVTGDQARASHSLRAINSSQVGSELGRRAAGEAVVP